MISKNDMYIYFVLFVCLIFSIITINYYNNPDNVSTDSIEDLPVLMGNYKLAYTLCILNVTFIALIVLILLLNYSGIHHKLLSNVFILFIGIIILLSIVQIAYAIKIAIAKINEAGGDAFGSHYLMGAAPLVSSISGILLIPSLYVLIKHNK